MKGSRFIYLIVGILMFTAKIQAQTSISIAPDAVINETHEGNGRIDVTVSGQNWPGSITAARYHVYNLPQGVSVQTISRHNNTVVYIDLQGNRSKDYDSNPTITVTVDSTELGGTNGVYTATSSSIFTALNDAESISFKTDSVTEGQENGKNVIVKLAGGTYANPITPANWILSNLPTGVTAGSIIRTDSLTVTITLSGNRTVDYDTSKLLGVSIPVSEYDDASGGGTLTVSSGFKFKANIENIGITPATTINEASENGKAITVTLSGGTYVASLTQSDWVLTGLPQGVTQGTVTRTDGTHASIALVGNRSKDYDVAQTLNLSMAAAEISGFPASSLDLTASSSSILTVNNDAESISFKTDSVTEGTENGKNVIVKLVGGTFANPITPSNWSLTNLPTGVTAGSIIRTDSLTVTITLSGNRTVDYDANMLLNLTIPVSEYDDATAGGPLSVVTGFKFKANIENIVITPATTINEAAENGKAITVTLSGGTYVASLTQGNWVLTGLPQGVTQGTVTRTDGTHASIALVGNRTQDYDVAQTLNLSMAAAEIAGFPASSPDLTASSSSILTFNNDPESISFKTDSVNEGSEDSKTILVKLAGGTFANPITPTNWNFTNLPTGVTIGSVIRTNADTVTVTLSGNRSTTYFSDLLLSLTIPTSEYDDHTGGSSLIVSTGFKFKAIAPSLSISGSINEASENGGVIAVTLTNLSFVAILNQSNWVLTGLPQGVSKGTVSRTDANHASITLVGNRSKDYDVAQNLTLTVAAAEISGYPGGDPALTKSSTSILNFVNDAESLSFKTDSVIEGSENGKTIIVKLAGGTFVNPITPLNWNFSNLPTGVSIGSVIRTDSVTATVTLSGNRTLTYNSDLILSLTIPTSEYDDHSTGGSLTISTGFKFKAVFATISMSGTIPEASENGGLITVTITTFNYSAILTQSNWVLTGLPQGVTQGIVTRVDNSHVTIALVGNRTKDYDSPVNLSLSMASAEISGYPPADPPLTTSSSIILTVNVDAESILLSGTANESSENGALVSVKLAGGTFSTSLTPANWTVSNLPQGVTKGNITRVTLDSATIQLVGNRTKDYDSDISNFQLTITNAEYDDHTAGGSGGNLTANSGFTFHANNDPESLVLYGSANEASENGVLVKVKLLGGTFVSSLNQSNWTLSNLPQGVSKGTVTRVTLDSATIALGGTRTKDYDLNITNLKLVVKQAEYDDNSGGTDLVDSTGFTFVANNDAESITLSGSANELSENAAIVTVNLSGGTFASVLDSASWTLSNLPQGVKKGAVTRVNNTQATIQLVGNRTLDYDSNKNLQLTITPTQYDDSRTNGNLTGSGFIFNALNDPESIALSWKNPPGTNGVESTIANDIIRVTLTGGTLIPASVNTTNVALTGSALAADGISLKAIQNVSSTQFDVALQQDGRDYDYDKSLRVTIAPAAYADADSSISAGIAVIATFEPAVLTVTDDGGVIEHQQDGHLLHLALQQDTFILAAADTNNIKISGQPFGINIGQVNKIDKNHLDIVLKGSSYWDYDSPVSATVTVNKAAILEHNTSNLSSNYSFSAVNDPAVMSLKWYSKTGVSGYEPTLNGDTLIVKLAGATFNPAKCDTSNVKFAGNPAAYGLSIQKVIPAARDSFLIVVSNDTIDFDVNQILTVTVSPNAYYAGAATLSDTITVRALNDPESISLSWNSPPGTNGLEASMTNEIVLVTLNGGTFITNQVNSTNITINGNATAYGVSMESITNITKSSFLLHLNWDSTDYDNDKTLGVRVATAAYNAHTGILNSTINLPATNDPESLSFSWAAVPGTNGKEISMNNEILHVTINGGSFVASKLITSHISLSGDATTTAGISIKGSIQNPRRFSFDIPLAWNQTDYDVNKSLQVNIDTAAYRDGLTTLTGIQPIIATVEKVAIEGNIVTTRNTQADIQLGLDTMQLHLIGASWKAADAGNLYLSTTIDTLIGGIKHIAGVVPNDTKLKEALKGNASGGYNNSVYRLNDSILVVSIPAIDAFQVQKSESFSIFITPKLLVGTKGSFYSDTFKITESPILSATLTGGGDICIDGHSKATITVTLGGTGPYHLRMSNVEGTFDTIFNTSNKIIPFATNVAGHYQVDTLTDSKFTIVNGDLKIYGEAIVRTHALPSPIGFTNLRSTYSKDEGLVDITASGTPSIGANSSHGSYSGDGIVFSNNKYYFYGAAAWLSSISTDTLKRYFLITYHYVDSVYGCTNFDTTTLAVIAAKGTINTRDFSTFYCYSHDTVRVFGTNSTNDANGIFSIDAGADSALIPLGHNQALLYPGKFPSSNQNYLISYKFFNTAHTDSTITQKSITIEPRTPISFVSYPLDSILCANAGQFNLASNATDQTAAVFEGTGVIFNSNTGKYAYDPIKVIPVITGNTNYVFDTIQLSYQSAKGCKSDNFMLRKVLGLPGISFGLVDSCFSQTDSIHFLNQTSSANMVSAWKWDFGDDQVSISQNTSSSAAPTHLYTTAGSKLVSLTATVPTDDTTCYAIFSRTISMGIKPIPAFNWNNECFLPGDQIEFSIDSKNGTMTNKDKFFWIFNEGLNSDTVKTDLNTAALHAFSALGSYEVTLIDTTLGLCRGKTSKTINLRPTITPSLDSSYSQDFITGKKGWLPDANASSLGISWKYGKPDMPVASSTILGDSNWYVPNISSKNVEQSWISSPCFNFSKLERPMIRMDILRNLSNNSSGAVVQYSTDNGFNWKNIGNYNDTKLWFNSFTIDDKISQSGVVGWSGGSPDTNWVNVRHWLDDLIGQTHIRFRVEFINNGSLGSNTGFAFNNVWIGERSRRVIMENFTSGSGSSALLAGKKFADLVFSHPLDVTGIQYHLNISGEDQFYNDNPDDPSARVLYYGIFQAPYSFMDGGGKFGGPVYDYISSPVVANSINDNDVFVRSLTDPEFSVKISMTNNAGNYNIVDSIVALHNIPASRKIIVQNALVERKVKIGGVEYTDVLKKLLPDASGSYPVSQWTAGSTVVNTVSGTLDHVYDANQVIAVVFLQDFKTKEILQAATTDTSSVSTGINEIIPSSVQNSLSIYPNPANNKVYFELSGQRKEQSYLTIYDMLGAEIKIITIPPFQTAVEVDLTGFSSGIYIVKPNTADIPAQRLVINK